MTGLGTISWVERTGGKLAWHERITLIAQAVRARAGARIRKSSGRKIRLREVGDIMPPDSAITREAIALSQDVSQPFLFNHCLRSYFWARLLDEDPSPFDDEALFTALMLHDFGLTEHGRAAAARGDCFTQAGAQKAAELAAEHGWNERRAKLTNAITLHLNVLVAARHGKEARMARAGSGADVAGLGLDVLHRDQIDEVVSRIPRLNLKSHMLAILLQETRARPDTRIALLCDRLHFGGMIRHDTVFSD
jgi:hypothetical protein